MKCLKGTGIIFAEVLLQASGKHSGFITADVTSAAIENGDNRVAWDIGQVLPPRVTQFDLS
jgi:hypothetical protein